MVQIIDFSTKIFMLYSDCLSERIHTLVTLQAGIAKRGKKVFLRKVQKIKKASILIKNQVITVCDCVIDSPFP